MIYVGIDPSLTRPGLAVLNEDGGLRVVSSLATKKLRGGERLVAIYNWALELLPDCTASHQTARAVIEGYAINANNRPFDLGEAGGVLRLALTVRGIPYEVAPPATVKKFITGNGQATKDQVAACIKRTWGLSFVNDDETDAYGMARMAQRPTPLARLRMPTSPRLPRSQNV